MSDTNNARSSESSAAGTGLPTGFSEMLDKVLANPQILTTVASALSSVSAETAGATASSPPKNEPGESEAESTASSPEIDAMMQKLPEMMKLISPMISSGGKGSPMGKTSDKRSCLLSAIKPYLSPARCEVIDYIIKFSQLSEIIKQIN